MSSTITLQLPKSPVPFWPGVATAILMICAAGITPITAARGTEFINAHRVARAGVGVRPLRWSAHLAQYAEGAAVNMQVPPRSCNFSDTPFHTSYGTNMLVTSKMTSKTDVVRFWNEGQEYYNIDHNSCKEGFEQYCAAFMQVVSAASELLGCGSARCGNDRVETKKRILFVCFYSPPADTDGARPYTPKM